MLAMSSPHISEVHRPALEKIASDMGCLWADNPSIGKLLAAIATVKLVVSKPWDEECFRLMMEILAGLCEANNPDCLKIAAMICNQPNIRDDLKVAVESMVSAWNSKNIEAKGG